jgi:hypothetical protein
MRVFLTPVVKIDLQTTKHVHFWNQRAICTRKSTISIYRATSNFDLHMRIFNLQDLKAPKRPKKIFFLTINSSIEDILRVCLLGAHLKLQTNIFLTQMPTQITAQKYKSNTRTCVCVCYMSF